MEPIPRLEVVGTKVKGKNYDPYLQNGHFDSPDFFNALGFPSNYKGPVNFDTFPQIFNPTFGFDDASSDEQLIQNTKPKSYKTLKLIGLAILLMLLVVFVVVSGFLGAEVNSSKASNTAASQMSSEVLAQVLASRGFSVVSQFSSDTTQSPLNTMKTAPPQQPSSAVIPPATATTTTASTSPVAPLPPPSVVFPAPPPPSVTITLTAPPSLPGASTAPPPAVAPLPPTTTTTALPSSTTLSTTTSTTSSTITTKTTTPTPTIPPTPSPTTTLAPTTTPTSTTAVTTPQPTPATSAPPTTTSTTSTTTQPPPPPQTTTATTTPSPPTTTTSTPTTTLPPPPPPTTAATTSAPTTPAPLLTPPTPAPTTPSITTTASTATSAVMPNTTSLLTTTSTATTTAGTTSKLQISLPPLPLTGTAIVACSYNNTTPPPVLIIFRSDSPSFPPMPMVVFQRNMEGNYSVILNETLDPSIFVAKQDVSRPVKIFALRISPVKCQDVKRYACYIPATPEGPEMVAEAISTMTIATERQNTTAIIPSKIVAGQVTLMYCTSIEITNKTVSWELAQPKTTSFTPFTFPSQKLFSNQLNLPADYNCSIYRSSNVVNQTFDLSLNGAQVRCVSGSTGLKSIPMTLNITAS